MSDDPRTPPVRSSLRTDRGAAKPLGASVRRDGVQFALFSRNATAVTLLLFASETDAEPYAEFAFDPHTNKTGDIWHIFVHGLSAGALYLYRVDGPYKPSAGHRFNRNKYLLDPYAKATAGAYKRSAPGLYAYDRISPESDLSFSTTPTGLDLPKGVVVDDAFDWREDAPINYPLRRSIIYECHLKGLTADPSSGARHPGTYLGVVEMIPYFKELGITSLEFLPLQEFNHLELERRNPETGELLSNYWGYSTVAFFAPKASYASVPGNQVTEFKTMVRELHAAGLEVILDVVFNHTAEGNHLGPTYNFRGLDNRIYYMLEENKRFYRDYSGCGNTLNCNHPIVQTLIIDSLHYWVMEMHVDGFRFDLGSILGRDRRGRLMENPPVIERIAEDPILRHTKIIAEAWDAGGAYQVGWFPGGRWAEWNDRYRDDVRRFWRGDDVPVSQLVTRMAGSSDLYLRDGRKPFHSVNFVTAHDGMTLRDLVSYAKKHNSANGESNNDGLDGNYSSGYGVEGETSDPRVNRIRLQQSKNFIATLLLSLGTPMMLGGDEFGRTQRGNNNAYCQDNHISWYDHRLMETHADLLRFTREMIAFRLRHHAFLRPEFYTGSDRDYNAIPDIVWLDQDGKEVDWETQRGLIAFRIDGGRAETLADKDDHDFLVMINAFSKAVRFVTNAAPRGPAWRLTINTAAPSPNDIVADGSGAELALGDAVDVAGRSLRVYLS